jgi:ABC-type uncharacterized transport system substrate-binding protein
VRDERFAERAATLVKATPDAIVSGGDLATRALQQATRTIPLMAMTEDMVAAGFVKSLARPGGNTTGISVLSPELDGKRQESLMDAVPGARRMAALADSRVTSAHHLQALQEGARARGVELQNSRFRSDIEHFRRRTPPPGSAESRNTAAQARGGRRRSWNQARYLLIFSRCAAGA